MRIYKNIDKNSILTANVEEQLISTRSAYYDTFLESLENGNYSMFARREGSSSSAATITNEVVVFSAVTKESLDGFDVEEDIEIYKYLGDIKTTEELLTLLQ
jgi:hypothetical protein